MRKMLLVALLLLPLSSAQLPTGEFSVTGSGPIELSPTESTQFDASVTFGCQEILLENGLEATVEFATSFEGVSSSIETLSFSPMDCIGEESVTESATILVSATNASGLEPFTPSIVAKHGSESTSFELEETIVAYRPGHVMTPNGDQTFQVDGLTYEFDLHLEILANAQTMVMFENKDVSGLASLTGLKANIFDVAAGDTEITNKITFTAPEGNWDQETVTFYTYSHCLGGENCGANLEQNVTWTFVNTADPIPEGGEEKSTPAPAVALLIGALLFVGAKKRK